MNSRDHGDDALNALQRDLDALKAERAAVCGLRACERCGGWADPDHDAEECDGILASRGRRTFTIAVPAEHAEKLRQFVAALGGEVAT